ncbi:MAG: hypothetical protein WC055_00555 [Melioribacteraceae bacterium]
MSKGEQIINEFGVWYDYEEIIHNYQEIGFKESGMYFNDELLFTWEELDDIKSKLGNNNG